MPLTLTVLTFVWAVLCPLQTLSAPAWDVWVADANGLPVAGITVRESYQNYSAESSSHEEDQVTNAEGYVKFAPKVVRASLVSRGLATLSSATAGVHASFGPHSYLLAFGKGLQGDAVQNGLVVNWKGSPSIMKTRIIG